MREEEWYRERRTQGDSRLPGFSRNVEPTVIVNLSLNKYNENTGKQSATDHGPPAT